MATTSKKGYAASDRRIAKAVKTLQAHQRGLDTLGAFRRMMEKGANGLDTAGMEALSTLTLEVVNGRRDFISRLPSTEATIPLRQLGKAIDLADSEASDEHPDPIDDAIQFLREFLRDADVYACDDCGKEFYDGDSRDAHYMSPACPKHHNHLPVA